MGGKTCNTCRASSKIGVDLFDIHICKECLDSIGKLKIGEMNYDHYKEIIGNSWTRSRKTKLN